MAEYFATAEQLWNDPSGTAFLNVVLSTAVPPPVGPELAKILSGLQAQLAAYQKEAYGAALLEVPKKLALPALQWMTSRYGAESVQTAISYIVSRSINRGNQDQGAAGADEVTFRTAANLLGIDRNNRHRLAYRINQALVAQGAPVWMAAYAGYRAARTEARYVDKAWLEDAQVKAWKDQLLKGTLYGTTVEQQYKNLLQSEGVSGGGGLRPPSVDTKTDPVAEALAHVGRVGEVEEIRLNRAVFGINDGKDIWVLVPGVKQSDLAGLDQGWEAFVRQLVSTGQPLSAIYGSALVEKRRRLEAFGIGKSILDKLYPPLSDAAGGGITASRFKLPDGVPWWAIGGAIVVVAGGVTYVLTRK